MTAVAGLTQLGSKSAIPETPQEASLETILISNHDIKKAVVRYSCPEFTSLCPVTGQPDFAHIYIDYIPDKYLVESKSLKLFMCSFRNHGAFHEDVTCYIGRRFADAAKPKWIRATGIWFPRGGIPIDIFWEEGDPGQVRLPSLKFQPYVGR